LRTDSGTCETGSLQAHPSNQLTQLQVPVMEIVVVWDGNSYKSLFLNQEAISISLWWV